MKNSVVRFRTGEFHLGDCFEVMRGLPDSSIDMVLCDLPYGTTRNKWDSVLPLEALWREYWRVCKPKAVVVLTAVQPFTSALVMSQPRNFRHDWVWEKNKATGHLNSQRQPLRAHEDVLVFARAACSYFPQMTEGHRPANRVPRNGGSTNYGAQSAGRAYGGQTTRYPRSVQKFAIINNDHPDKWHPTQKPAELFEYLIRTYSTKGMTVLDNTAGSGTTAVAAIEAERGWVCIEQDQEYFEAAVGRVTRHEDFWFDGAAFA